MTEQNVAPDYRAFLGARCTIPTPWGGMTMESVSFTPAADGDLVATLGDPFTADSPLVRIHSECVFAEAFASEFCDCALQLQMALSRMRDEQCGILFYLRFDGRGAGLAAKVAATALEIDEGLDTYESRIRIGVDPDDREYDRIGQYLSDRGVTRMRLLTNNPTKLAHLRVKVPDTVAEPLRVLDPSHWVETLYETKHRKFGHFT